MPQLRDSRGRFLASRKRKALSAVKRAAMGVKNLKLGISSDDVAAIRRAFNGVKVGVANRVLKGAIAKVSRRTAKVAKSEIRSVRSGLSKKSIGTKYRQYGRNGTFAYVIGMRKDFVAMVEGRPHKPYKIAHLIERGRAAVRPIRARLLANKAGRQVFGSQVAPVAPDPFMEPALLAAAADVRSTLVADVRAGVAREAAKYVARGKSIMRIR